MRSMLVLAVVLSGVAQVDAQSAARPTVIDGQVVDRALSGGLAATIAQIAASASDIVWVGYAVPMVGGDHQLCGWNSSQGGDCCGACGLEPTVAGERARTAASTGAANQVVRLEPSHTLMVLARIAGGRVERVRTFSEECRLDAGGRVVQWLTNVRPAESVRWLSSLAGTATERRLANGVLTALAFHAEPAALDRLIDAARGGVTAQLRGQALFWLAQRAGDRAVGAIAEAIEHDPDTDVKKRAVFAISQLPRDESVPRLITIARDHSNKAVQKQAFFWLGQSNDPRALAFFAEVLKAR